MPIVATAVRSNRCRGIAVPEVMRERNGSVLTAIFNSELKEIGEKSGCLLSVTLCFSEIAHATLFAIWMSI